MRRGAGIGAIRGRALTEAKYKEKANQLAETQVATLTRQIDLLRSSLETFAAKHGNRIKNDPQFRGQFQAMCSAIGVDPISYSRGYWSELLGLGEFYYHLGIRIIELCLANQKRTGGIMPLDDLVCRLNATKSSHTPEISADDVQRSIKKLRCLGTGFMLITLTDGRTLVQSVPGEISMDKTSVLGLAASTENHTTVTQCCHKFEWTGDRARVALNQLVQDGLAWVDDQAGERSYWFACLIQTGDKALG